VAGGTLYVPYGGHFGDCGNYRGWLVGVPLNNPASVVAWATGVTGGGAWGVGGVASDGSNLFLATGNTFGAGTWSGGEAIIKFTQGPTFSGLASDYWAPMNWMSLDAQDTDIGSSGPVLMDVPGATPSALAVALGKDGNAYLLNRGSLGGVSTPLAQAHVSSTVIVQAAAAYRSAQGVHVAFCNGGQITSLRLGPANPPTITSAWTSSQNGRGSPFVTSTDGTNNVIVWGIGCEGDGRLHGFDGDTGAVVFGGGGPNEVMGGTRRFNTGIAAHGRIFVAADDKVYAFSVPAAPTVLTRQIPGVINALWDLSLLTNELQNLELRAEKVTRGAINFMQASFAAPYAQDGRGKLAGSGSNSVAWISNLTTPELTAIEATWLSTGSVTGSKGVVRVVYSVKALGQASLGDSRHPVAARAVTARANYAARFDPALNQVTGRRSDTISATGLATLSNSEKIATAFPAELGDGSWTLAVQFGVVNGTKSSGTATVALSSGQIYPFNFTGTLAPRSGQWRLNLKGVDAGLGSILQVTVQASDITRIVGRVSGQSVNIKQ
jgi:hypothetical protein